MMPVGVRHRLLLVGVVLAVGVMPMAGCGNGGGESAQAVEWGVSRQVGPRQVKLVATVKSCGGQVPAIERTVIEYSGARAFIGLFVVPEEEPEDGVCLLELLGVTKVVTLRRDLDRLELFDSSTDPPERRWPL